MYQNVPNPFSKTTEISFYVSKEAFVEIELFNLVGEKIETIEAKNFDAGSHTIVYNKKNLSAGTYFYRFSVNSFATTKIMNIAE